MVTAYVNKYKKKSFKSVYVSRRKMCAWNSLFDYKHSVTFLYLSPFTFIFYFITIKNKDKYSDSVDSG